MAFSWFHNCTSRGIHKPKNRQYCRLPGIPGEKANLDNHQRRRSYNIDISFSYLFWISMNVDWNQSDRNNHKGRLLIKTPHRTTIRLSTYDISKGFS